MNKDLKSVCRRPAAWLLAVTAAAGLPAAPVDARPPGLQIGLAAAADYSAVYPSETFVSPVSEVSASFDISATEKYLRMSASLIAVDVGTAAPPNYPVLTTSLDLKGMRAGRFRFEMPRPMPAGRYRIDLTADGQPWRSADFRILSAAEPAKPSSTARLIPLNLGRTWTYAFWQKAGEGVQVDLPDIAPESDGSYRAPVTLTVAALADGLAHVETRRKDRLVFEEWLRLDNNGLAAVKRREDGAVTVLDPPQMLLPLPLGEPKAWDYRAADGSFSQTYRMWGPVPVRGPAGEAPGYVVLATQRTPPVIVTVERHFLPGAGMVREVLVQALNGNLITRHELVLTTLSE